MRRASSGAASRSADPQGEVDAATRERLELTLAAREFARDALAVGRRSYSSLAQVDEGQVIHVVPRRRATVWFPHTWWFPIAGRVPYRGYFDRADALALAAELEREGFDTYTRPSVAFSTLGWFDDPLLSNLLRLAPERLVEVVLHELLHNTIYLSGQTAFNESYASFVGARGAIDFFAARGERERAARAAEMWADSIAFSRLLAEVFAETEAAYAAGVWRGARTALAAARARFVGAMGTRSPSISCRRAAHTRARHLRSTAIAVALHEAYQAAEATSEDARVGRKDRRDAPSLRGARAGAEPLVSGNGVRSRSSRTRMP